MDIEESYTGPHPTGRWVTVICFYERTHGKGPIFINTIEHDDERSARNHAAKVKRDAKRDNAEHRLVAVRARPLWKKD